eukprot:7786078-Ditylum_brightwellii.AAC.1
METDAENLKTHNKCKVTFILPKLHPTAQREHTMHVTNHQGRYDMKVGSDLLHKLGINLDFKENNITWSNYQADMKLTDITMAEHLANV